MSLEVAIILLSIIFMASFVRATFGFADGLIGMPLLLIVVDLKQAVVIANFFGLLISLMLCAIDWKLLIQHWKEISLILLFSLIGTAVGFYFLDNDMDRWLIIMLASILLLYPVIFYFKDRWHYRLKGKKWAPIVGVLEGFLGVTIDSNGPPMTIYGQIRGWDPENFVAVMQPVFLIGNLINILIFASHHYVTYSDIWLTLAAIPLCGLAVKMGQWLRKMIAVEQFEHMVVAIIFIAGVLSLYRVFQ